jgi:hypothetical protein
MKENEKQSELESESEYDIYKSYDSGYGNKNSISQDDVKSKK